MSLRDFYDEDRRKLHEIAMRYQNAVMSGASEVAYLALRAEKQLERMQQELEQELKQQELKQQELETLPASRAETA